VGLGQGRYVFESGWPLSARPRLRRQRLGRGRTATQGALDLPAPFHPSAGQPGIDSRSGNGAGESADDVGLLAKAESFVTQFHIENQLHDSLARRLEQVRKEITTLGTYRHTSAELAFAAQVAWRNSSRCIGRLYWRSLRVRDRRHVCAAAEIAAEAVTHLREATNGGRIRPLITVFAPDAPGRPGPRILSSQLVRYAGYEPGTGAGGTGAGGTGAGGTGAGGTGADGTGADGTGADGTGADERAMGDPANVGLTRLARELGWPAPATPGRFDLLPLLIQAAGAAPSWHELPADAVLEVPLQHPTYDWFSELGLRWYAVPVISDMRLEAGGIRYPAAPFNGWYMGTEIGSRNLGDATRYNQLPSVAARLGLSTGDNRTLWQDRAMTELNVAVLHSFSSAGVTITDHHTESVRFLKHLELEERQGRACPADWTWIVPPSASSATPVFHRYYDNFDQTPNFYRHSESVS
jgi:nitric-oxide synthase, bacterial